jgi:uncharacterized protein YhjY with autotransporter beta-barrel domain
MKKSDLNAMAVVLRSLLRAHGVWVALFIALLFTASPGAARAATCAIDFSVNYNATNYAHVMSMTSNFDEFAACDPRYIASPGDPASGFAPYVQIGATANGGSFATEVNNADDTIIYNAPTGFSGTDTFTVYFCDDINCSGAGARVATVTVTVGTPTILVNPVSLPAAAVAAAYSQTLTGSGGQAPYGSFTVISGALPAGLSLAAGGALTGTPTASGSFNFTIRTTDNSTGNGPFQGSRAYTLVVNAPTVVVNPTSLPAATVGTAYSQTATGAGGTAPYDNFIISAGALPAGLSLNSSSGALTGTPTAGGAFNFSIRTTDSTTGTGPHNGTRAYSFTVNAPTVSLAPTSLPSGVQGSAYAETITASGGTASYAYAITSGALPAGLSLSAGGVITGTPTVNGSFPLTVTATDSSTGTGPYTGSRGYTLVIAAPPAPVANAVSQTVGYNSTNTAITLNITGGAAASVATPGLPTHGTVNVVGTTITYTPTTNYGGPDSFTYTATNPGGTSAAATVTITVSAPTITVDPASLPNGTTGVAYSQSVSAAGGSGAFTYAVTSGAAPAGLTLSPAGVLSGTPSGTGPYNFTVTATDTSTGNGPYTGARAYTVTIITPDPPIAGAVSATVAYDSVGNPITLNLTGGAPTSVAVSTPATNGTASAVGTAITYTPTPGYFGPDSFAYTATNADGTSAPATVTITVNPQPPVAGAVSATVAQDSSDNPITLSLTGGTPVSVNGSAVVNGSLVIAGTSITFTPTPGYNGPASFSYTATNAGGTSAPATVSITVNPLAPVANAVSAVVAYNTSNNPVTLNVSGGTPTSVATPGLPSNGTVSVAGTAITYTPTTGYFGPDSFTYTATNAGGTSAPATVTVTVHPQPPIAGAVSATVAQDSSDNPITLDITGGAPVSVNGSAVVNGSLVIAGTSITFTPTPGYNGPASFSYTATNAGGTSAPATVSITVTPLPPVAGAVSVTVAFESSNNPVTLDITGGAPASVATPGLPSNGAVSIAGTAITYTPAAGYAGPDSFTYTAANTGGTSAPATVTVTVNPPPVPTAGAVSLTVAANSSNNAVTLSLGGGTATSVATPGLPTHGAVSIAGTAITYTPTAGYSGADSFTYTATNLGGTSAPATVTVTVSPPTLTLSALTTTGQVTAAYSSTAVASLGTAPYGYAVTAGAPPTGLTLSSGGVLSGSASAAGTFNFTVTATDTHGATGSQAYVVTIDPPTVAISSPAAGALASVEAYGAYSETFAATGGVGPHSFSVTSGALPTGLSLSSGGVLSGAPTVPGVYNFSVTPADGSVAPGPYSGPPLAYSLTVTAPTIVISPAAGVLPAATTALAYSETLGASGGIGPYDFVIAAGALPGGLSLTGAGVISGTPIAAGTYNFTIEAADSHGFTGTSAYSVTVSDPVIAVTSPSAGALPSVEAYGAYTETFTASGGTGPHSFALSAGALPPGLSLTGAGVLSGTPTTPGTYNFSITASDSSGAPGPFASAPAAYSITVTAPTITLSPAAGALPAATTALAYSQTFTAGGGVGPHGYSLAAGALPPEMSLSGAGVLSGAATAAGAYNFTIEAADSHGFTTANAYSITVTDPVIVLTSPAAGALPSVEAYGSYTETFTASGGTGPHSFALSAGALPPGLSLTGAGVLSGAPTTPGTYNFSIVASDSSGAPGPFTSAPVAYSLTVTAPTITLSPASGALPPATSAQPYDETFTASGGVGPYSYALTAGALPPGLSLTSGGVLSGIPTAAGTYNFTITAEDSHGFTTANAYSITATDPVVTLTTPAAGALPGATAWAPYSQTFTATGGVGPRTFAVSAGALPAGLSLAAGGLLSGTPTSAGTFSFSITASDSSGAPGPFASAPVAFDLTVAVPTVTITAPAAGALPAATASAAYSQTFTATGGSGSHSFAVTAGSLPPGLGLSGAGVLSGAPTTPGTYNFTLVASDTSGAPGPYASLPVAYSLTVVAPTVTITAPAAGALPGVTAFGLVNQTFTAVGGSGPHTFALVGGALPAGVSLSGAGVLSGAPTTPGTYNFSLAASDSSAAPGPFTSAPTGYSLTVSAPTISFTPATLPDGTTGQAYAQTLTASGGTAAYSYGLTAGALPPGVALAAAGALSGTPTAAGTFGFTITVTDAHGFSTGNAYSLHIIDAAPVAAADAASTPANQPVDIPVTANDTGVITSVAVQGAPAHGTAVVNGLAVTYAPEANYFGADSFTYTATGPGGTSAPATVTVTVTPLAAPTAAAQVLTVLAGRSGSVNATSGSTGAPITAVAVVAAPVHGTAAVSGQTLVYTPAAGYSGADSFTYTLANPFGVSVPAAVTVTVNPAPVTAAPITVEILAGQTASVDLTADAAGGPFTAAALVSLTPATAGTAAITNPAAGQYGLTFTPADDFAGTVTATYTLSNAFATSAAGTVTVIVTARPDPGADPDVTGLIAAQGESARRFATAQISNVNSRLESLRDGGGGGTSLQLNFSGGSRALADDSDPLRRRLADDDWSDVLPGLAYGGDPMITGGGEPVAGAGGATPGRFGLWAAGGIDFGHRDATTGQKSVEFDTDGLTAGADLRLSDQFVLGASLGWAHDESRIGDDGTRSNADGRSYAVYASYQPDPRFFIDGVVGHGTLDFESRRYITASGEFAYGRRDGSQSFGAVTGGWDMRDGRRLVSPYGRLSATRSELGAFAETTGGADALAYESQTVRTLTGTLGVRGAWSLPTSFGEVIPRLRLEYSRDFQGADRANLFYVDWIGGPVYGVEVDPLDQNRVLGGFGLDVLARGGSRVSFEYEVGIASGAEQHRIQLEIQTRF